MSFRDHPSFLWFRRFMPLTTIAVLAFIGYMFFAGESSIPRMIKYDLVIDSLYTELDANRDTMLYYRELNHKLTTDPELMEQVVREQYGMKRESEDVYLFKDPDNE